MKNLLIYILILLYFVPLKSQIVVSPVYHAVQYKPQLPVVETIEITDITALTAQSGGNVTHNGGSNITSRGVVWSNFGIPTIQNNEGMTHDSIGIGAFTSTIFGLTPETNYYVRAYASNTNGIAYGLEIHFTTNENIDGQPCPLFPTVTYEDYTYNTVQIGNQCWLAENLRYLPSVVNSATGSNTIPYYYVYNYQGTDVEEAKATQKYEIYGVLYNWTAALNAENSNNNNNNNSGVQGICPDGWHIPSHAEWSQLTDYLIAGGYNYDTTTDGNKIAKSMASDMFWSNSEQEGAIGNVLLSNNSSGFNALPGGYISYDGIPKKNENLGYWWSSKGLENDLAYNRCLSYEHSSIFEYTADTKVGISVRCVKKN